MGSTSLTGSSLRTGGPCCCLCSICGSVPGGGWWWSWVLDSVGYTFTHLCLLPAEKLILQWMIFMIRIIVHDFCDFVFFRSSPFFYFLTWASTLKPWVFVRYGCFLFCVPRPILPARAPVKKQKGLQWGGLFAGFQAPQWLRICRPAGGAKKTNKPLGCLEPWGEPHEAHGKVCQVWGLVPPLLLLCCSPVAPLVAPLLLPLLLPCCSPVAPRGSFCSKIQQMVCNGVRAPLYRSVEWLFPEEPKRKKNPGPAGWAQKQEKQEKQGKTRQQQENTYPAHQPDRKNRKKYPGPAGGRLVPGGFFSCFSFPAGGLDRCFPVFAWFFPVFPVFPVFWLIRPAPEFVFLFGSSGN